MTDYSRLLASAMNCRLKLNDIHLELSAIITGLGALDNAPFVVGEQVRVRDGERSLTVVRLYRTVEGRWWVHAHDTAHPGGGTLYEGDWPAEALVRDVGAGLKSARTGGSTFQVGDQVVVKGDRGPVMTVDQVGRFAPGGDEGALWVQADGETWRADMLVVAPMPDDPPTNPPVILGNPFKGKGHKGPAVDD